jgi:hypothetical protein
MAGGSGKLRDRADSFIGNDPRAHDRDRAGHHGDCRSVEPRLGSAVGATRRHVAALRAALNEMICTRRGDGARAPAGATGRRSRAADCTVRRALLTVMTGARCNCHGITSIWVVRRRKSRTPALWPGTSRRRRRLGTFQPVPAPARFLRLWRASRLLMVPPGRGMARRHRSGKPVTSSADHPVAALSVNDAVGDEQDG